VSLKRVLGPAATGWLVAGSMIGAGIFYTPGAVAGHLPGLVWPLVAWALGGVLALFGAAVYAELGGRLPHAGGDYQYLIRAYGRAWGFLTGWAAMLLTFSAAASAMALVAMQYSLTAAGVEPTSSWTPRVLAAAVILVLTLANVLGARVAGAMTASLTTLAIGGLLLFFGAGLVTRPDVAHWPRAAAFAEPWPLALGAAMLPIFFAYSGWNSAAYVAGELRDPGRTLVLGLLGGTGAVTVVYLLMNAIFLFVVPQAQLAGSQIAPAQAARILFSPAAERVVALGVAIGVFSATNVTLMAGARIYYAMAKDGLFFAFLAGTNAAGVPSVALWGGGAFSASLALFCPVDTLVNWATLAILLVSSLAVLALFVLRKRARDDRDAGTLWRCPLHPWIPLTYLVACIGVGLASTIHDPAQSLYGLLIVLAGLPVYWVVKRRQT
jgi:basic amino acid/polyamine antiporter, APA family